MVAIERRGRWVGGEPASLFVLSAKTIHNLGIRDYSLGRKSLFSPNTFGQFAFG
jgi:hypothetical protein